MTKISSSSLSTIKACIALDAMGGDYGPSVVIPAALDILQHFPNVHLILVGNQSAIAEVMAKHTTQHTRPALNRLRIHATTQEVHMDDSPSQALRSKKDSSMRVAINLVKDKEADACVSAGNTGALMAIARFVLRTLPGIDRPAIVYSMPIKVDHKQMSRLRMLDLGANVDCQAEHLFQFAVMGSILAEAVDNIERPKVGLLNIGQEAIKGSEAVKKAALLLTDSNIINYVGFVEGTDINEGLADVVVCDGFVGNVALKCIEGTANLLKRAVERAFKQNWYTAIVALFAIPVLKKVAKRVDPGQYNGATLLGLNGIVVKSHGNAKRDRYKQAIIEAIIEVEKNIPERIRLEVEKTLGAEEKV